MNFVLFDKTKIKFARELEKLFGLRCMSVEKLPEYRYKVEMVGNFCSLTVILEHGEDKSQWEEPKRDKKLVYGTLNMPKIKKGEWRIPFQTSCTSIHLASLYQIKDIKNLISKLETGRSI